MSAIYVSFRDVSGILTLTDSIPLIFPATAAGMVAMAVLASRMHPRIGVARVRATG